MPAIGGNQTVVYTVNVQVKSSGQNSILNVYNMLRKLQALNKSVIGKAVRAPVALSKSSLNVSRSAISRLTQSVRGLGKSLVSYVVRPFRRSNNVMQQFNNNVKGLPPNLIKLRREMYKQFIAYRPYQSVFQGLSLGMAMASGNIKHMIMQLLFLGWGIPKIILLVAALTAAVLGLAKALTSMSGVEQTLFRMKQLFGDTATAAHTFLAAQTWAIRYGKSISEVNAALFYMYRNQTLNNKTMHAAITLSGALGISVDKAAQLITQAIGKEKANFKVLEQYGVHVEETLANTTSRAAAATAVADAIEKRYAKAADEYAKTSAGAWQRIKSAVQGAMQVLFAPIWHELFTPALNTVANFAAKMYMLARAMWHNKAVVDFWNKTVALAKKTVHDYAPELRFLASILKNVLVGAFWVTLITVRLLVVFFRLFLGAIRGVRVAFLRLGKLLKPLAGMFGMLAQSIKHLTFGGVLTTAKHFAYNLGSYLHKAWKWAKKQWDKIKTLFKEKIKPKLDITWSLFKANIWAPIKEGFIVGWENFKATVQKRWPGMKKHLESIWHKLFDLPTQPIRAKIKSAANEFGSGVLDSLGNIWAKINTWLANTDLGKKIGEWLQNGFWGSLSKAADWIAGGIADIDLAADNGWSGVFQLFKKWGQDIWISIKQSDAVRSALQWVSASVNSIKQALSDKAHSAVDSTFGQLVVHVDKSIHQLAANAFIWALDVVNSFVDGFNNIIAGTANTLLNLANSILEWVNNTIIDMVTYGTSVSQSFVDGFNTIIGKIGDVLVTVVSTIASWVVKSAKQFVKNGHDVASNIVHGFHDLISLVLSVMGSMFDKLQSWVKDYTKLLRSVGHAIADHIKDGIRFTKASWNHISDSLKTWLTGEAHHIVDIGRDIGWKIWSGIKSTLDYAIKHFGFGGNDNGGGGDNGGGDDGGGGSGSGGSGGTHMPVRWFGNGLDAVVYHPTVIGVGESGAERVTVTPLSNAHVSTSRNIVIHITGNTFVGTGGVQELADLVSKEIARRVEQRYGIAW